MRRQSLICFPIGKALASWVRTAGNCWKVALSEASSGPREPGASTAASCSDRGDSRSRIGGADLSEGSSARARVFSGASEASSAVRAGGAAIRVWSSPDDGLRESAVGGGQRAGGQVEADGRGRSAGPSSEPAYWATPAEDDRRVWTSVAVVPRSPRVMSAVSLSRGGNWGAACLRPPAPPAAGDWPAGYRRPGQVFHRVVRFCRAFALNRDRTWKNWTGIRGLRAGKLSPLCKTGAPGVPGSSSR